MDRLDVMRLFTRVVERRSFTAAANDMNVPRSTTTQVIRRLEERLGVNLLLRTTRTVRPTLDGEAYYQRCKAILHDVEEAEGAFGDRKPKGPLRVEIHGAQARRLLFPRLAEFMQMYPDIELDISEGDRYIDLVHEGVDCAIRTGELRDSDLIARRLALLPVDTVASPAYCKRYGMPTTLGDLNEGHVMVGFKSSGNGMMLPLEFQQDGRVHNISLPTRVRVGGADSYLGAALADFGIIQAPRYRLRPYLVAGQLLPLLEAFPSAPMPVSLVYPRTRLPSPRLRVFIDWVREVYATA
ncbi:LysR family transcriptional regulator [Pseudomonas alloputida]|uniref:LysR family transcriptional regulator n=2 Tax=Pseudomonas alloputida TaxID=1940621 RepID=A0ABY3DDB2_9PSED|nr:LysR family transcriptional regulator [Pseudomonas alloputida]